MKKYLAFILLFTLSRYVVGQSKAEKQLVATWSLKHFAQGPPAAETSPGQHQSATFIFYADSTYSTRTASDSSHGKWLFDAAKKLILLREDHENELLKLYLVALTDNKFICEMNSAKGTVRMVFHKVL